MSKSKIESPPPFLNIDSTVVNTFLSMPSRSGEHLPALISASRNASAAACFADGWIDQNRLGRSIYLPTSHAKLTLGRLQWQHGSRDHRLGCLRQKAGASCESCWPHEMRATMHICAVTLCAGKIFQNTRITLQPSPSTHLVCISPMLQGSRSGTEFICERRPPGHSPRRRH
jgi:hypothetical protein